MSEPSTDTVPRLVPPGKDALDNLTLKELSSASQALGCDVARAFHGAEPHSAKRYLAWAQVALTWARRQDPAAKLATFLDYETDDLAAALGLADDEEGVEDPTEQTSEDPSS